MIPMVDNTHNKLLPRKLLILVVLLGLFMHALFVFAAPEGAQIGINTTETRAPNSAASLATAGGSFTTLILNGTFQTPRWKAYVGNVSGKFTLDDASGSTIYDWSLLSIAGEVYASRNNSITWATVNCSTGTDINNEQSALQIAQTNSDSINRTFNTSVHRGFYVGSRSIVNSTCPAIATYVNDTRQIVSETAQFQEVLLSDGQNLIYTTIIEPGRRGFDNNTYNFQLIVAENEYASVPTRYFFYLELS
jgi:hypothetical protein